MKPGYAGLTLSDILVEAFRDVNALWLVLVVKGFQPKDLKSQKSESKQQSFSQASPVRSRGLPRHSSHSLGSLSPSRYTSRSAEILFCHSWHEAHSVKLIYMYIPGTTKGPTSRDPTRKGRLQSKIPDIGEGKTGIASH